MPFLARCTKCPDWVWVDKEESYVLKFNKEHLREEHDISDPSRKDMALFFENRIISDIELKKVLKSKWNKKQQKYEIILKNVMEVIHKEGTLSEKRLISLANNSENDIVKIISLLEQRGNFVPVGFKKSVIEAIKTEKSQKANVKKTSEENQQETVMTPSSVQVHWDEMNYFERLNFVRNNYRTLAMKSIELSEVLLNPNLLKSFFGIESLIQKLSSTFMMEKTMAELEDKKKTVMYCFFEEFQNIKCFKNNLALVRNRIQIVVSDPKLFFVKLEDGLPVSSFKLESEEIWKKWDLLSTTPKSELSENMAFQNAQQKVLGILCKEGFFGYIHKNYVIALKSQGTLSIFIKIISKNELSNSDNDVVLSISEFIDRIKKYSIHRASGRFDNLSEDVLTPFGWHSDLSDPVRHDSLILAEDSLGSLRVIEVLSFLVNNWKNKDIRDICKENVKKDFLWFKERSLELRKRKLNSNERNLRLDYRALVKNKEINNFGEIDHFYLVYYR
jgi:hypothetical protein